VIYWKDIRMLSRIDVRYSVPDARAAVRRKYFEKLELRGSVRDVAVVDSYVIDAPLGAKNLKRVGELLANPLVERYSVNIPQAPPRFDWAIEVGPLPGMTDNLGATAREVIEDGIQRKFRTGEGVYASRVFFVSGKLLREDIRKIADSLHNPLIERVVAKSFQDFGRDRGMGKVFPKVRLHRGRAVVRVNLRIPDNELEVIGKAGILGPDGLRRGPLALDLPYMKAIQAHFGLLGRNPTDIELESIAQTWSEHCKHTIFANSLDDVNEGLYRGYIKAATAEVRKRKGKKDFCVSVFTDNSGAVAFDGEFLLTHKVETHNSPSALDPFGGAITGIVGVNRDAIGFGLGAKPVVNTYGFCLADPRDRTELYRDASRTQKMLSARRILEGVVAGVNAGGNCSGIPTPQGFVFFDPRYRGKPLVFAGTVGLIPRRGGGRALHRKGAKPGDYVVMVGNRVGQDGIHGATFSSVALDSGSPATAVQIGDPITQKKMSDALVKEARGKGLYTSITDNGAGGLSCSVAEMARESGGCLVELEKTPLKYPGLEPWQIWISETQERMTLAVPPGKWKKFFSLMKRRGVEATVIGKFTDSGRCVVKYRKRTIMDIDLKFLHEGWPRRHLKSSPQVFPQKEPKRENRAPLDGVFLKALQRPNIASFLFISSQYDHEVQAGSVLKPLAGRGRVNADATVTRPVLRSRRGVVLSQGLYPLYSEIDAYRMAAASIDTAIRSAVAAGADIERIALLDNFCWCSSYDPRRLAELKEAARACYDCAVAFETPFISGKDSMFNDFRGFGGSGESVTISVPPTLLISAIGLMEDVSRCVSLDFKFPGDLIYMLGETHDELGGSEYFSMLSEKQGGNRLGSRVPEVVPAKNRKLYEAVTRSARKGLLTSSVSIGRGGLGIALARSAMGGMLGAEIDLGKLPGSATDDDLALFSESQGRILVGVNPKKKKLFEAVMRGNSHACLGKVAKGGRIRVRGRNGARVLNLRIEDALRAYQSTFKNY